MGQSPSADLYWGYDLGDLTDRETWESLRPDWMEDEEETLARRLGWVEVPFPANIPEPDYSLSYEERKRVEEQQRDTPEYRAWSANRSEIYALVAPIPVELDRYGYLEDPAYCVRVKASVQSADDWGSIAVKPLIVLPEWPDQLAEFMRLLDLPIPSAEAGWHMNCSYG